MHSMIVTIMYPNYFKRISTFSSTSFIEEVSESPESGILVEDQTEIEY